MPENNYPEYQIPENQYYGSENDGGNGTVTESIDSNNNGQILNE